MFEDQDNAGEVVAGAVRVALTAAGQLAEQAARRREADLREAERESAARLATVQSQLAAERELVLRSVRDVVQRGDVATVEEVMHAWEQARSWDDPTVATERRQLEDRVRERFGVDVSTLDARQSAGEQALAVGVVARDVEWQAAHARQRGAEKGRGSTAQGNLVDGGISQEAAKAGALAAQSHPIAVAEAARRPAAAARVQPKRLRRAAVEVQAPGR